ncbi:MAG: alanine racemase [Thermoleophilia bacterium]|nr:alanine racemase [Thermoleophilia bacterium]
MRRSQLTVDLAAVRHNVAWLATLVSPAELWAVVKADAYGHGALDVAGAALQAGASALCVATVQEGEELRRAHADVRVLVLGPLAPGEDELARECDLEVTASSPELPTGLRVHAKVDTGMGRWGMSPDELDEVSPERVVGLMSHLATADEEDGAFAAHQLEQFLRLADRFPRALRHLANSAAAIRYPDSRLDAVRCGIALYGLSPFGRDPATDGLRPVLSWRSYVAQAKTLAPGESTGYGRRFVAGRHTRIGLVPVGYADGFRRDYSGTEVLVAGARRRVIGRVSMDSFAVELHDEPVGAEVALIGDGLLAEEHARVAGTINYEVTCAVRSASRRAERLVIDA